MSVLEMPDVILMDVALGAMDGWEATRLIRADPKTLHIPIIALTAHALATDRDKSIEVGCTDFDTKPVDLERLLRKIDACLQERGPQPSQVSRCSAKRTSLDKSNSSEVRSACLVSLVLIPPRRLPAACGTFPRIAR